MLNRSTSLSRPFAKLHRGRWKAVRLAVLERDGYRCKGCGKAGRLEVDHIRSLHRGGDWYDMGNLQALCRPCHFAKTAGENRRYQKTAATEAWSKLVTELL